MSLLPYGVCVIGLLSAGMLGLGLKQLRPHKQAVQSFFRANRIRMLTRGLLMAPMLAVAGLFGGYLAFYQGAVFLRITHGIFIFGLWTILTIDIFVLALVTRLGVRPALQTLASPVLAVPLVAYMTPVERFMEVFQMTPAMVPTAAGTAIILASFFLVFQVRRELL